MHHYYHIAKYNYDYIFIITVLFPISVCLFVFKMSVSVLLLPLEELFLTFLIRQVWCLTPQSYATNLQLDLLMQQTPQLLFVSESLYP